MPNPVVHFEIIGADLKLLEAFYAEIFDWQAIPVSADYSAVHLGPGISAGLGGMAPDRRHVTFYVQVEDIHATLAQIESRGGQTAYGPLPMADGALFAGFTDPEGHLIGLVQPRKQEQAS